MYVEPHVRHPPLCRHIRIPPQYLLDSYMPRYLMLTRKQLKDKIAKAEKLLHNCRLCPHNCAVDRYQSRANSCITGINGSGSIFFASCNMRCVFCQNHEISHIRDAGEMLTAEEVGEWMVKLQDMGQCINFVTPEHVVPIVVKALTKARGLGLKIPIVYNTSSFDSMESLKLMDGLVDIYLADFKLWLPDSAKRLLESERYPGAFTGDGLAKQGVLIRHRIMPNRLDESRQILKYIANEVDKDSYVNIMSQYFPSGHEVAFDMKNRHVTDEEIEDIMTAARRLGLWRFNRAEEYSGYA
ncbi:hypothetical protein V1504DRAFT_439293 [Lipomyces starkeyi]